MPASKNDKLDRKPDVSLVYQDTLYECARAMMAGEQKYGRFNYTDGHTYAQLVAAAIRHLQAALWGEDLDADCSQRAGVPVSHLGCVLANLNMLIHQQALGTLVDDRFKADPHPGPAYLNNEWGPETVSVPKKLVDQLAQDTYCQHAATCQIKD